MDNEKMQNLQQQVQELETQTAVEVQETETWLEILKQQHEGEMLKDRQTEGQELQALSMSNSCLIQKYKSLLQRHTLLLGAFKGMHSVIFDEDIPVEAIRKEAPNKMEIIQSKNRELIAENKSIKEMNASLNIIIFTKLEKIEKLEARINTLTMNAEKSAIKIQDLETGADALNKVLQENIQSVCRNSKLLNELQSHYGTEKKMSEDERNGFGNESMMFIGNYKKEEEEKEAKRSKEEEEVRKSVQPRNNVPKERNSIAIFTPISCTESIQKFRVKVGECCYRFGLDISKYNVLAVASSHKSVYLYSEITRSKEKLCTCEYEINCLAWNQEGTLLAMGGRNCNKKNNTIQVWDIPNRNIIKRLKTGEINDDCICLDWNKEIVGAVTGQSIHRWNINDLNNCEDNQGNKALLPRNTIRNKHGGWITSMQWSNCKSKLMTMISGGDMCIYDEQFELKHHIKAHDSDSNPTLQWCPWDNQVVATCCIKGYIKIWIVQQDIKLIKEIKHEFGIENFKWIPSKKAIISAHLNNQLILWEYPSLSTIRTMEGHANFSNCLTLNADKSAIISKSDEDMVFWKSFDQF